MKVAKEYKWEMGHRLHFHDGRCKNLHGHSYKAIFEFEGGLNENGMVIDFYEIDKIVNPIVDELDHAFLCHEEDIELLEVLTKLKSKTVIVKFPTTAENISKYLCDRAANSRLPKNLNFLSVKVFETTDSYSESTITLN
ncbi:MAG: 6-carboxytetrahydropterin synthase [Ignavibacteria bacterium]|nr:6-carboxytetrahydropterin synthase [Ignavibacteria bacterium]